MWNKVQNEKKNAALEIFHGRHRISIQRETYLVWSVHSNRYPVYEPDTSSERRRHDLLQSVEIRSSSEVSRATQVRDMAAERTSRLYPSGGSVLISTWFSTLRGILDQLILGINLIPNRHGNISDVFHWTRTDYTMVFKQHFFSGWTKRQLKTSIWF